MDMKTLIQKLESDKGILLNVLGMKANEGFMPFRYEGEISSVLMISTIGGADRVHELMAAVTELKKDPDYFVPWFRNVPVQVKGRNDSRFHL